jgi:hypothetical protein
MSNSMVDDICNIKAARLVLTIQCDHMRKFLINPHTYSTLQMFHPFLLQKTGHKNNAGEYIWIFAKQTDITLKTKSTKELQTAQHITETQQCIIFLLLLLLLILLDSILFHMGQWMTNLQFLVHSYNLPFWISYHFSSSPDVV